MARGHNQQDLPPLFETPKAGDPITLDAQEQWALTRDTKQMRQNLGDDRLYPSELSDMLLSMDLGSLTGLAETRLRESDFKGAASTCVKVLGLYANGGSPPGLAVQGVWALLAEIHVAHGDFARARAFLVKAEEEMTRRLSQVTKASGDSVRKAYESTWRQDWA